jgi:hypothetical protein
MNEIIQMGVKLFEATKNPESLKFSIEESNKIFTDKLIKESMEYAGLTYTAGQKMDFQTYSHPLVKHKLFNLISTTIDAIVPKYLMNQFDRFIDIRNVAWGDKLYIEVTSPDLFSVTKVSHGNVNVRRQKLDRRSINLTPIMREVKVYEDLYRLLAGRVDWATYVNKVALSVANDIHTDAYTAFYDSYDATDSTYFASGAFSGTTFNTMAEHVKAANGGVPVQAWGTKLALAKVNAHTGYTAYPGLNSANMLDEYNRMGYYGQFQGTDLVKIDQAHTANTNDFAISDSFIIITPVGLDKPIKLGFEGEAIFTENNSTTTQDQQTTYSLQKAFDLQILSAGRYGWE